MLKFSKFFVLLTMLFSFPCLSESNQFSTDELKAWIQPDGEKFHFYSPDIIEIHLTSKETAYLVPVSMENAGRNDMFQTALAIPSAKKLILLTNTIVNQIIDVLDIDNDGVSEIIVKKSGSGGGSEIGKKAIVQIKNNGEVAVIHEISFYTNEGEWGKSVSSYHMHDAEWEFVPTSSGANTKDMIETIIEEKGRKGKAPHVSKVTKRYHFVSGKFVSH